MDALLTRIGEIGMVPVVKIEAAATAPALGRALVAGGIPVAEITFRTAAAAEAIRTLRGSVPELLVGAGTVLDRATAETALEAGASFIVSPGFDEELVRFCLERGVPVLPGVSGPDGVMRALALGLEAVKLFPAEAIGGLPLLDALAGPFPGMRFVPTGGIAATNLGAWARHPAVLAVGGSWMVPASLVDSGDEASITALCRAAIAALHGFRFAHVGVNGADEAEARAAVGLLGALFGVEAAEGQSSFMFEGIEITKRPFPGARGHLAIACNDVERAVARLAALGAGTLSASARYERGRLKAIYLDRELLGFAIHLLRA